MPGRRSSAARSVLALVNGLPVDDEPLSIGLNVLVLLILALVDRPALYRRTDRAGEMSPWSSAAPARGVARCPVSGGGG